MDAGRADLSAALPHLKGEKVQHEAGDALIASYSATGELDKAAQTVSVLLDGDPANPALLLTSYRLYAELANNAIVTLALAGPDSAELHVAMAHELVRHGDDDADQHALQQKRQPHPERAPFRINRPAVSVNGKGSATRLGPRSVAVPSA